MATKIKTYTTSDNLFFNDLNAEFDNIYSALNGGGSASVGDGTITEAKLTDDANPAVYFAELFADGKVTSTNGFTYISDTGLSVTITSGTAYVLQTTTSPDKLRRVDFASSSSHTVLDNTTNYLDLGADGVMDVSQASVPASDHMRILKIISSGGTISGTPTDEADRTFPENQGTKDYLVSANIDVTNATTVTIAAGISCRDTTNNFNITTTSSLTLDITNSVGVLGLDQGAEGSSKWYAVVLIKATSGVLPESAVLVVEADYPASIFLPAGYDIFRRVAWVRNDSSSDFIQMKQHNNEIRAYTDETLSGTFSTTTFTDIATNNFSCPDAPFADIVITGITGDGSGGAENIVYVNKAGVGGTTGGIQVGKQNSTPGGHGHVMQGSSGQHRVPLNNATRQFSIRVTNNNISGVNIQGYVDSLGD